MSNQRQVANYIGQMCAELGQLALDSDLGTLAYLLDIAGSEALREGPHSRVIPAPQRAQAAGQQ